MADSDNSEHSDDLEHTDLDHAARSALWNKMFGGDPAGETYAEACAARQYGPPPGIAFSDWLKQQLRREAAAEERELAAARDAPTVGATRGSVRAAARRRASDSESIVFTVRLSEQELAALETRARRDDVRPSVLARKYIRSGLAGSGPSAIDAIADRLATIVADLRGHFPTQL